MPHPASHRCGTHTWVTCISGLSASMSTVHPRPLLTAPCLQVEAVSPEDDWGFCALEEHTGPNFLRSVAQAEPVRAGEVGIHISCAELQQVSLSHRLNLLQSLLQKNLFCSVVSSNLKYVPDVARGRSLGTRELGHVCTSTQGWLRKWVYQLKR